MRSAAIHFLWILLVLVSACKKPSAKSLQPTDFLRASRIAEMLDDGMSPNQYVGHRPMLSVAAGDGTEETVALLLSRGADVKQRSRAAGKTALSEAAWDGELRIAALLLDAGADPNEEDIVGNRPL